MKNIIIAIDGTAASGKGTLAKKLAQKFRLAHMDTGSLYRLVALRLLTEGRDPADEGRATEAAQVISRTYKPEDSDNPAIRTDEIGQVTSRVSTIPAVRAQILDLQRNFSQNPPLLPGGRTPQGAVLDGRDIGTVVCPGADVKFFVTAAVEIRADRRFKELQSKGLSVTYDAVLADMRERDARDAGRTTAPMKPAQDAIMLDTSAMTIEEVVQSAVASIRKITGLVPE
jgi:cytidylate kinase